MDRRTFINIAAVGGMAMLAGCVGVGSSMAEGASLGLASTFARCRKFLGTRFGNIAYADAGVGPAALFLHGFPLNSFQWRDVIQGLAPHRRCLAPDFLGLGYTHVGENVSLEPANQVAMLVEFLDKLGIDQVDLVGNDSGGAVAQLLFTRHPERIRTVLLTNCDTEIECPPNAMEPVLELASQDKYAEEWLLPWWKDPSLARTPTGFGGMCYRDLANPTDEAVAMYFTPLVQTKALRHRTNEYALALAKNSLEGIGSLLSANKVPVGVVWGTADNIFSLDGLQYLIDNVGNMQFVDRLDGYKLFWPEERPDVVRDKALKLWKLA